MAPASKAEGSARGRAAAKAEAAANDATHGEANAKDAGQNDANLGLDAILAAAAEELRSSSGSADGSEDEKKKGDKAGKKGDKGSGGKHGRGKDASGRKSGRDAGKGDKAGKPGSGKDSDAKVKAGKDQNADEEEKEVELEANGKPKLPRPEGTCACPRCASEETKFCYYNNYNVKQPRYFCRGCQRYWTAGGMLRNVPVGAGRRKNKNGADFVALMSGKANGQQMFMSGKIKFKGNMGLLMKMTELQKIAGAK